MALPVDALACTCDVHTWKLPRRDMGSLDRIREATMTRTVQSLLGGG